jgi:hypothetical protein
MASDGLFDVMGDQSVVDTVSKYLREHDNWCAPPPSRGGKKGGDNSRLQGRPGEGRRAKVEATD